MAGVHNPSGSRAFKSTNDLSAKQFFAVALDGSNGNSVVLANAQTNVAIGILQNAPVADDVADVMLFGPTSFVIAGGTITKGARVTCDSAGKAISTTTAADQVIGVAIDSGVAGDRIEVMLVNFEY